MSEQRERTRVTHPGGGPSRVKVAEMEKADVNDILNRWVSQGLVLPQSPMSYGDFSDGMTYHEAMNRITEAQQSFAALPSHIRKHVRNDPGEFLDMVFDPERVQELVDLGLVEAQAPEAAKPLPSPSEPPAPAAAPSSAPAEEPSGS